MLYGEFELTRPNLTQLHPSPLFSIIQPYSDLKYSTQPHPFPPYFLPCPTLLYPTHVPISTHVYLALPLPYSTYPFDSYPTNSHLPIPILSYKTYLNLSYLYFPTYPCSTTIFLSILVLPLSDSNLLNSSPTLSDSNLEYPIKPYLTQVTIINMHNKAELNVKCVTDALFLLTNKFSSSIFTLVHIYIHIYEYGI